MASSTVSRYQSDLELALRLADAADKISLGRFGAADLHVDSKPDLTPVSDADLAVERTIRELLNDERKSDAVIGEEFGDSNPDATRKWIVDPIDGTKNFVRGVPVWATLIALFDGPQPVVGVVSAPALARRWWASLGGGAFTSFNRQPATDCRVSGVSNLADASLTYSDLAEWRQCGRGDEFSALLDLCWRNRGYGDFLPYVLVAQGSADIACEPDLNLWDLAALGPIVTEAGGLFTDVDGRAVDFSTTSAIATNGVLHDVVVGALQPGSTNARS